MSEQKGYKMGYRRKLLETKKLSKSRIKHIEITDYRSVNRQCLKKNAYGSEKIVTAKITEIAEEGRTGLRYYLCPLCDFYHISHKAYEGQEFVS